MKDALKGWAKYPLSLVAALLFLVWVAPSCGPTDDRSDGPHDHRGEVDAEHDFSVPAPTIWLDGYELGRARPDPMTIDEYVEAQR